MEPFIPLDKLKSMLSLAWVKAHPEIPDTTAKEHAKIFWAAYMNDAIPEKQEVIQKKIRELNQGIVVPKDGPTLNQLWYGYTDDKEKTQVKPNVIKQKEIYETSRASSSKTAVTRPVGQVLGKKLDNIFSDPAKKDQDFVLDYNSNPCNCCKAPDGGPARCCLDALGENEMKLNNQSNTLLSEGPGPVSDLPVPDVRTENSEEFQPPSDGDLVDILESFASLL